MQSNKHAEEQLWGNKYAEEPASMDKYTREQTCGRQVSKEQICGGQGYKGTCMQGARMQENKHAIVFRIHVCMKTNMQRTNLQGTCKVTACRGTNQKGQILGNKHAEEAACMDKYARE
jgi:hypothetical protein